MKLINLPEKKREDDSNGDPDQTNNILIWVPSPRAVVIVLLSNIILYPTLKLVFQGHACGWSMGYFILSLNLFFCIDRMPFRHARNRYFMMPRLNALRTHYINIRLRSRYYAWNLNANIIDMYTKSLIIELFIEKKWNYLKKSGMM